MRQAIMFCVAKVFRGNL